MTDKVYIETDATTTVHTTHKVSAKLKGSDRVSVWIDVHSAGMGIEIAHLGLVIPMMPLEVAAALEVALGRARQLMEKAGE